MPGWLIAFAVSFIVSMISAIIAKPKARKQENNIQRQGIDQDLERLYGTRRMSMVVTNASTNSNENAFGYSYPWKRGKGIQFTLDSGPRVPMPNEADNAIFSYSHSRTTMLHMQGPVCVKGRRDALFCSVPQGATQSDPKQNSYWGDNEFQVLVNDKDVGDSELVSRSGVARTGAGVCLYLKSNIPDDIFEFVTSGAISGNDTWSQCIHAYAHAFQDLEAGSAKFTGIPDISFMLESNKLWDPSNDFEVHVDNPGDSQNYNPNWSGRPDNPILQLLDFMLDREFGGGFSIEDINLDSFKEAVNMSNLEIAIAIDMENQFTMLNGFGINGWNGGGTPGYAGMHYPGLTGNRNPSTTLTRREKQPLLTSHITISTEDTLSDNLSALLAACRGARLFKNKQGKWTINTAWLMDKDMSFSFESEDGREIYGVPFFPVSDDKVTVKVDGVVSSSYEFVAGGDPESQSTGSQPVDGFRFAEFFQEEGELKIHFWETPPIPEADSRYAVYRESSNPNAGRLSFVPSTGTITIDNNKKFWLFKGAVKKNFTGYKTLWEVNGQRLHEIPNDANDNQVGLKFTPPVPAGSVISLDYDPDAHFAKKAAARIIRDPNDIGLDYDAYEDSDGLPLIRLVGDMSYQGVSIDDRYNQCIVKYHDEALDYDYNEIEWPKTDSIAHLKLLAEDNSKPLINTVTVNHLCDKSNARDYAEFVVRQSRSADQLSFKADFTAIGLEPNDIILVSDPAIKVGDPATIDDNSQYWRVVSTKMGATGSVEISCVRYEGEDYAYLSELLEDRKYKPVVSPIPPVTFPPTPVEELENKAAGFGILSWIPPAGLSNAFTYRVAYSTRYVYSDKLTYQTGDIVWSEDNLRHYESLVDNNSTIPEEETSATWRKLDNDENAVEFTTIQADTDSPNTVIPNVEESRYYTYRVQIRTSTGLGPPAYLSIDINAFSFGVGTLIRLDSTKDVVVIPRYSGIVDIWDTDEVYPENALTRFGDDYYLSLVADNTGNQPDSSPAAWAISVGGLMDFSKSEFEIRMYKADEVMSLSVDAGGDYSAPVDIATADDDCWWIESITEIGVDIPPHTGVIQTIDEVVDDYIMIDDILDISKQSLTGQIQVKAIYKDDSGVAHRVTKNIQYIISSLGADGIDGGSTVQLSCYLHTPEEYDASNNLIFPPSPGSSGSNGTFDFDSNILVPPTGWTPTPPQVTDGIVWVSYQLHKRGEGPQPEDLGDWSSPTISAVFGGTIFKYTLYARESSMPTKPADNDLIYDFGSEELRFKSVGSTPIDMDNPYVTNGSSWYPSVPAGDAVEDNTYVIQTTFSIPGRVGIDNTSFWSDPASISAQGKSIYNALLLSKVPAGDSAPSVPIPNLIAYNFDKEWFELSANPGVQVTQFGSWYDPVALPSIGKKEEVYATRETFSTFGAVGTDETSTWSPPKAYLPSAADGTSSYFASIYTLQSVGKIPETPTGGIFDFDLGEFTELPTGKNQADSAVYTWGASHPDLGDEEAPVVWLSQALVTSDEPAGIDDSITWGQPVRVATKGIAGSSTDIVFKRETAASVSKPGDSAVSPPTGWYTDVSNVPVTEKPMWSSVGKRENQDTDWVWQEPTLIEGQGVAELTLYRRGTSQPATPGTAVYNLATANYTSKDGNWYVNVPSGDDAVWMSKGVASGPSGREVTVNNWTSPTKVFEDGQPGQDGQPGGEGPKGDDGEDGTKTAHVVLYKNSSDASEPKRIVGSTTYNWASSTVGSNNKFGWSESSSSPAAGGSTWQISVDISAPATASTTTISASSWSASAKISGGDGQPGTPGAPGTLNPQAFSGIINIWRGDALAKKDLPPQDWELAELGINDARVAGNNLPFYLFLGQYCVIYDSQGNTYGWVQRTNIWDKTELITADMVYTNAIQSKQLQISEDSGSNRMYFNGADNRIEIWANGQLRIKLGKL